MALSQILLDTDLLESAGFLCDDAAVYTSVFHTISLVPRRVRGWIRRLYYRWGYGSDSSLARLVGGFVQQVEQFDDPHDGPISRAVWDEEYEKGQWAFLRNLDEVPHYSTVAGLHHRLSRGGSILDVGCGAGVLHEMIRPYGYSRYLGLDMSASAVATLHDRCDERTRFIVADAETFQPDEKYDTIIFCESLYYFRHPIETLRRYAQSQTPNGVFIISIWQGSPRSRAILAQIRREFPLVTDIEIRNARTSWAVCANGQK